MALDFDLEINSELRTEEILRLVSEMDGFHKAEFEDGFYSDGLIGGVISQNERDGYYANVQKEMLRENFGFQPTLKIWFRPDGYENYEIGMRNGLRAFMKVLESDGGDAVCLLNGESVKFVRLDGKLILNPESFFEKDSVWTFDQVPFPFETKQFQTFE